MDSMETKVELTRLNRLDHQQRCFTLFPFTLTVKYFIDKDRPESQELNWLLQTDRILSLLLFSSEVTLAYGEGLCCDEDAFFNQPTSRPATESYRVKGEHPTCLLTREGK